MSVDKLKIERAGLEAKKAVLNAQLTKPPQRVISEEQLRKLHARLERLHTAKLLAGDCLRVHYTSCMTDY